MNPLEEEKHKLEKGNPAALKTARKFYSTRKPTRSARPGHAALSSVGPF